MSLIGKSNCRYTASPKNLDTLSSGTKEPLQEPLKTLSADNLTFASWQPEQSEEQNVKFSSSLILQTQNTEGIRAVFNKAFENSKFYQESPGDYSAAGINDEAGTISKSADWRGPALIQGLESLIFINSPGLYFSDKTRLNSQDQLTTGASGQNCYGSLAGPIRNTISTVVRQALELRARERANHALWLEKQKSSVTP